MSPARRGWIACSGALLVLATPGAALAGPLLDIKPARLEFVAPVGEKTASQLITLTNPGDADLTIYGTLVGGADGPAFVFMPAANAGLTLAAGKAFTFMVSFQPKRAGRLTAQVTVFSDIGQTPGTELAGNAGARVATTPAHGETIDFGTQIVGGAPAPQPVTLFNDGNAIMGISALKVYGGTPDAPTATAAFTVDEAGPLSLAAGRRHTIHVSFVPGAATDYAANLEVDTTDPTRYPSILKLTGSGVAAGLATTPDGLTFAPVTVGQPGVVKHVALTNGGALDLPLTIAVDAPQYAVSPATLTLRPGGQMEVAVTFTPDGVAEFPASVGYSITGGSRIASTSLYGQGAAPSIGGQDAGATTLLTGHGGCSLAGGRTGPWGMALAAMLLALGALLRRGSRWRR